MELCFEKLTENHASAIFPIWNDHEVIKYTYIRNINTIQDAINKIQVYLNYPYGLLGPFVVKLDHNVIGLAAGMSPKENPEKTEIFFHFDKSYWRKGYGSKVIDFLINEGFNVNNYNVIEAKAVTSNVASWKLLEKKGFTHKKLLKNAYREKMDIFSYYINQEEYIAF